MRIFLTGATGYIGGAVFDALVKAGHDVTALVRDNEKARRVGKRGGHPVVGSLADPATFRARLGPYYATEQKEYGSIAWKLLQDATGSKLG